MKVLLDNCVKREVLAFFPGHEAVHVVDIGWADLQNGELLRRAAEAFDVLVTVDRGMRFQSNGTDLDLRVAVLHVRGNMIEQLRDGCAVLLPMIADLEVGAFTVITVP